MEVFKIGWLSSYLYCQRENSSIKGFCAATHNQGGSDADDATFDCNNDNN
jgi:hypothetical protein